MGPTLSTVSLGCSANPEEEKDYPHSPRVQRQVNLSSTADNTDLPFCKDSNSNSTLVSPELELESSPNSVSTPGVLPFHAYHTSIESIVAASTPIPSIQSSSESQVAFQDCDFTFKPSANREVKQPVTGSETEEDIIEQQSSLSGTKENIDTVSEDTKAAEVETDTPPESEIDTTCGAVAETESFIHQSSSVDPTTDKMETVAVTADINLENGDLNEQPGSNPLEEVDDQDEASKSLVALSNTPIAGDSGQNSPTPENGTSDDGQKQKKTDSPEDKTDEKPAPVPANVNVAAPVKETAKNGTKEGKKDKTSSNKNKKKEDKGIEYILRALNSLQSPEEKLAALCKRYADMHEEHRVLQTSFKTQQRTMTVLMREKDQVQSDHAKAVIAKSKLESLCRELQKQNKLIKDESIQRAKEDDEKRREISARFQTTIGEIQTQMNNNNERNSKLQQENMELATQLKKFVEQYENREKKMKQHRDLEQQVAEARLVQARALLKEEQEKNAKEKELLLMKAAESAKKVSLLEAQVTMFKDRYDEFESLHTRSNETFQKYKTEMDKMTKRIKRLEKDGLAWKSKWERTNKSLVEAVEARSNSEKETATYVQKTKKLESLCRALQAELHKDKVKAASPVNEVPPNSPEAPVSGQTSPDSTTTTPPPMGESSSTTASPSHTTATTTTTPSSETPTRGEGDGQPTSTTKDSPVVDQTTPSNEVTESPNSSESITPEQSSKTEGSTVSEEGSGPQSSTTQSQSPQSTNCMDEVED